TIQPTFDPNTMTFSVFAANAEGHPGDDPARRDPWIDIRDTTIAFELTAPRRTSLKVDAAETQLLGAGGAYTGAKAVLDAWDPPPPPPARTGAQSDYPSTAFTLDLLVTSVVLRPPFLHGARLLDDGLLVADPARDKVTFTLPKLKIRFSQGTQPNDPINVNLLSLGASGLDDTSGPGVADLITMDPPHAFIGDSNIVGFGFRTAVLDLSEGSTPPE